MDKLANGIWIPLDGGAAMPQPSGDLEWTLRYGEPTTEHLMEAASILSAYDHILRHPAGTESIIRQLRKARRWLTETRKGERL